MGAEKPFGPIGTIVPTRSITAAVLYFQFPYHYLGNVFATSVLRFRFMSAPRERTSEPPVAAAAKFCPECGANVAFQAERCWLCHRPLHASEIIDAEIIPPPIASARLEHPFRQVKLGQFSLETLLMVITLAAVCLGMTAAAPGMGILIMVIAVPALIRTVMAGHQERQAGRPMSAGHKFLTFLASTGIVLAVVGAGCSAFLAACMASGLMALSLSDYGAPNVKGDTLVIAVLGFSSFVGIAASSWIFWLTRPRRHL